MKETTNVFGIEFDINLPFNTVEEFDQLAGQAGACLREATQHVIAHKHLARVRAAVCKKLEELSGIAREKTTSEDGKNEKFSESEQTYFKRVVAAMGGDENWSSIVEELKAAASAVKFEIVVTRQRITKEGLECAKLFIAQGKAEAFAEKRGITLPEDEDEKVEVLAVEIKKALDEARKNALASLV